MHKTLAVRVSPVVYLRMLVYSFVAVAVRAVALLPLIDMALAVYGGMTTFGDIGIAAYERFEPGSAD